MAKRSGHLTEEQVQQVLRTSSVRDRALIHVLYAYGLRISEGLALKRAHVTRDGITLTRAKGSAGGPYPMLPEVWASLQPWLASQSGSWLFPGRVDGRPLTCRAAFKAVRNACLRAGIDRGLAHPHVLKHSLATHLGQRGLTVQAIAAWLGHKSLASSFEYIEHDTTGAALAQAFKALESKT